MNLTDEEIRIKVAEACGWSQKEATFDKPVEKGGMRLPNYFHQGPQMAWTHERQPGVYTQPLNYPADLNACASFEATLTDEELSLYGHELGIQTECMQWYNGYISAFGITVIARATARQRCLAYLKTKGLI